MHPLAQRVLSHIRQQELLQAGDRVGVAVSGGIDSVALLRLLLELRYELGIVLSVVHFNHKLRGAESDADQESVAGLAREHDLELLSDSDDVAVRAAEERISVETAARELRYGFFRHLLGEDGDENAPGAEARPHNLDQDRCAESAAPSKGVPQGLKPVSGPGHNGTVEAVSIHNPTATHFMTKVATGHTLDDQAETVLMRLIRGAGLRGLGAIYPRLWVEDDGGEICGEIVRPLLNIRRKELEQYLKEIGQSWREDSSNSNEQFTRNRLRKLVVPLLEKEFNPAVAENLAELAEIARGEEDYWENEIAGWLGTTVQWSEPDWAREDSGEQSLVQIASPGSQKRKQSPADRELHARIDNAPWKVVNASVSRMWFLGEPVAVQRRLVKAIGEHAGVPFEFKHVEEILRFAAEDGPSGKELSLPLGWKLVREPEEVLFLTPDLRESAPPQDYEYELSIPGQTYIAEDGFILEVQIIEAQIIDARRIKAQGIPAGEDAAYNSDHLLDAESLPGR